MLSVPVASLVEKSGLVQLPPLACVVVVVVAGTVVVVGGTVVVVVGGSAVVVVGAAVVVVVASGAQLTVSLVAPAPVLLRLFGHATLRELPGLRERLPRERVPMLVSARAYPLAANTEPAARPARPVKIGLNLMRTTPSLPGLVGMNDHGAIGAFSSFTAFSSSTRVVIRETSSHADAGSWTRFSMQMLESDIGPR